MMPQPTIRLSETYVPEVCRCGTRIPSGQSVFRVTSASEALESLFGFQVFCSVKCVRAFILESLEILDAIDTPASNAMVTDLHELYRELAEMLSSLLGDAALREVESDFHKRERVARFNVDPPPSRELPGGTLNSFERVRLVLHGDEISTDHWGNGPR
jgi:hypothetical protein